MIAPSQPRTLFSRIPTGLWFAGVALVAFASQTWAWWHQGGLLAGMHADGPFHFVSELVRSASGVLPTDPMVQANRDVGAYEHFYASVIGLAKLTGWSLLTANLAMCWAGNFLYLAGVFALLRKLHVAPWSCALGTWLGAQPFVFIGMSSGVTHSLAIPREVWLWPMPWFAMWFATGRREGVHLIVFYVALGAIYAFTYPLWAALLGVAFGLADAWAIVRERRWPQLAWLAAAGVLCLLVVAVPALSTLRAVGGDEGALLDYNQITRAVYFTKGFRRLLLFGSVGIAALWCLLKEDGDGVKPWRRLGRLLLGSLLVCVAYEPLQRFVPSLSMLYLGRLSLVVFLVSMVSVAAWLEGRFGSLPKWGKALVIVAVLWTSVEPVRSTRKELALQAPPARTDFVEFCRWVKQNTKPESLAVVEPTIGSHYFRVYAERGLWMNTKDTGVLSRSKKLFSQALERLERLNELYAPATSVAQREAVLDRLRGDGVAYMVTRTSHDWAGALSWPVVHTTGIWQLRAAPAAAN